MGGHQSTQCPHEIITRLSSRGRGWFLSRAHPGLQICIGSGIHRQNGVPVLAAKPLLANTVACTCRGSTPIPMFSTANAQQYHQNKQRSPRPERPEQATEPHRNFTASFPHKGSEQCRLAESRAVQIIQAEKNSHFFSAYAATIFAFFPLIVTSRLLCVLAPGTCLRFLIFSLCDSNPFQGSSPL